MNKLDIVINQLSKHPQVVSWFTVQFNHTLNARLKKLREKPLEKVKLPSMEEYLNRKRVYPAAPRENRL